MARALAKAALLVAALAAAPGCVHRTAHLGWPPRGEAPAGSPPAPAPAVSLQPLDDRRPGPREVVGDVWFGWVRTPDDVAGWATAALRDELQRAGVRVVAPAPGVPALGGEVRGVHASTDWLLRYWGEVRLRAWVRSGDAVTYDAHVLGEGTAGLDLMGCGEHYAEALGLAVRDASRKVASAVAAAAVRGEAARAAEPAASILPAPPAPEEPAVRARAGWYLGVLLGVGGVDVRSAAGGTGFSQAGGQSLPASIAVQLGFPVGRRWLVGGEWDLTYAWHTVPAGMPDEGLPDRDVVLNQGLATVTFYPLERSALAPGEREVAPRGWHVRAGAGVASLSSKPDPDTAAPGSASWKVAGGAFALGTGWAFWTGRTHTRTGTVAADFAWQAYGSSPSEPERSFSFRISMGLGLF